MALLRRLPQLATMAFPRFNTAVVAEDAGYTLAVSVADTEAEDEVARVATSVEGVAADGAVVVVVRSEAGVDFGDRLVGSPRRRPLCLCCPHAARRPC